MQSGPERRRRCAQALARDRTLQSLVADLVAARTDAGMSQAEVAARMFTATSAVSRLESGRYTPGGHFKLLHLWPGQIPPPGAVGRVEL